MQEPHAVGETLLEVRERLPEQLTGICRAGLYLCSREEGREGERERRGRGGESGEVKRDMRKEMG